MDVEGADALAGVVQLLRRAAEVAWAEVVAGPGSARQVLALGIDITADEAARLLLPAFAKPGRISADGGVARLLHLAEQLLAAFDPDGDDGTVGELRREVADLVRDASAGVSA